MPQYARVVDALVVELFSPPDGVPITDCFHADLVPSFHAIPDGTSPEQG